MTVEHVENAELNTRFMEVLGVGDGSDDGGVVPFTVKELLLEQRDELRRIGDKIDQHPTKEDLDRVRVELHGEAQLLGLRMKVVEDKAEANEIRWAKLTAGAAVIGVLGGGVGATIVRALGVG